MHTHSSVSWQRASPLRHDITFLKRRLRRSIALRWNGPRRYFTELSLSLRFNCKKQAINIKYHKIIKLYFGPQHIDKNTYMVNYTQLFQRKGKVKKCSYIMQVSRAAQCTIHCTTWQLCSFRHKLGFSGKHSFKFPLISTLRLFPHISTTVYSLVLNYPAEWTAASWREWKCSSFETAVEGKRQWDRPTRQWLEDVKEWTWLGLNEMWWETEDRVAWRKRVSHVALQRTEKSMGV